jgi:hypothetical protein
MPKQKHLIEIYYDYNIFIVSTPNPFFIAEKDNPALGGTIVEDSLYDLRDAIDANIKLLKKLKINTKQITPNQIIQNISSRVKADRGHSVYNIKIVLTSVCNLEPCVEEYGMNKNISKIRHHNRCQKAR